MWSQVRSIVEQFNQLNPYRNGFVRNLLKIEDVNFIESNSNSTQRQLYGYAVSAKRYALYCWIGEDIRVVKASGHGLGYLYPPTDGFNKDAGAPSWIVEAWEWQLRQELGLPCAEPDWLDLPAFMRITLSSPNVMRYNRPDWLLPFNFFFLPIVSELGGYPAGCSENARFIAPFCSDRRRWTTLGCVNIFDGESFEIAMSPSEMQDKVVPDTFRIVLRQYLERPEAKSLAPDGSPCRADTRGLLKRASIVASRAVPIGKECDRRWEQGDEMSLADFRVQEHRESGKMLPADAALQARIIEHGIRRTMRDTGLSQHTIEAVIAGKPVRRKTLVRIFRALRTARPRY